MCYSKELDSTRQYELAFSTHINPKVGERLAELLTREDVRSVTEAARIKRLRTPGERGGGIGGVETARTAMGLLRHMYSRAMEEGRLKRKRRMLCAIAYATSFTAPYESI